MKNWLKYFLQWLCGFRNYLFLFSLFKIGTLRWDKNENDFFFFLSLLPEGGLVLDIGANIGITAGILSKRHRVVAFEPMPFNADAFERVMSFLGRKNVRLHRVALGNEEGEVEMILPIPGKVKEQGLSHVVHPSITEYNKGLSMRVPLRKLDNMNELQGPDMVTGVKMDVENYESFVLKGPVS